MIPERTLRPSKLKSVGYLSICAGFAAIGVRMGMQGDVIGWVCVSFFGLGVLVFALILLPGSSFLRIDDQGFTVRSLFRQHSYRWSDVRSFWVQSIGGNAMVVFDFAADYQSARAARKLATTLAGAEGALPDSYGLKPQALAELLNSARNEAMRAPGAGRGV